MILIRINILFFYFFLFSFCTAYKWISLLLVALPSIHEQVALYNVSWRSNNNGAAAVKAQQQ